MTIPELAKACVEAINRHTAAPVSKEAYITLVFKGKIPFPKKNWPRPVHLLCENPRGERVYLYSAANLLAAMIAHKLIEMRPETEARHG